MKDLWICTYGTIARLVLASTREEAVTIAAPMFDGFPPDAVYPITDDLVTLASRLIQLARDRVGDGAESRFRYRIETVVAIWRGAPPPDDWQERYAREWQRCRQLEDQVATLRAELETAKTLAAVSES